MPTSNQDIQRFAKKARIVLFILLGLSILGWIIPEFLGLGGIDITISSEQITIENPNIGTNIEADAELDLETPAWFDIFMLLTTAATLIFWFAIIYQIERLFFAYQKGEFFSISTARRLRNVGWIMLAAALVSTLQEFVGNMLLDDLLIEVGDALPESVTSLSAPASIDYPVLIGALAITVIARVMEKAAALQDEMNSVV
ncbi:MAG: DUF2975 domain-containing protein [Sneathiella sp.]